jgi:hypothetical protein
MMLPLVEEPMIIKEEEDHYGYSSFKQFTTAIGDRPGEIDNSDIEGENIGTLKQNLIV